MKFIVNHLIITNSKFKEIFESICFMDLTSNIYYTIVYKMFWLQMLFDIKKNYLRKTKNLVLKVFCWFFCLVWLRCAKALNKRTIATSSFIHTLYGRCFFHRYFNLVCMLQIYFQVFSLSFCPLNGCHPCVTI